MTASRATRLKAWVTSGAIWFFGLFGSAAVGGILAERIDVERGAAWGTAAGILGFACLRLLTGRGGTRSIQAERDR